MTLIIQSKKTVSVRIYDVSRLSFNLGCKPSSPPEVSVRSALDCTALSPARWHDKHTNYGQLGPKTTRTWTTRPRKISD